MKKLFVLIAIVFSGFAASSALTSEKNMKDVSQLHNSALTSLSSLVMPANEDPGTLWTLLAGVGIMGVMVRRRIGNRD